MSAAKGTIESFVDRMVPGFLRPYWEKLRRSNVGYKLAHGAFWSMMGAGMSQVLMLLTSIVAARILGKEQFGQYGIVFSTVGMFSIFAGFGLGITATKFVAEYKHTDPARAGRIIVLSSLFAVFTGVIATVVLLITAPALSSIALAAPDLSGMLQLATGMLLFGAINGSQLGALAGFEAFRGIARINTISGITSFLFVTGGILFWGLAGALVGQVGAMGCTCLVASLALRYEARRFGVPLKYAGIGAERGILVKFSLPAVLAGLMVSPVLWACSAILVNQANGYSEMGIFNAANFWQRAILFVPGCISTIALPMLSGLHGENKREKYRKTLWYSILMNGGIALAVAGVIAAASGLIMRSYGPGFSEGAIVLVILSFSTAIYASVIVVGQAMASVGEMWWGCVLNVIWAIVIITMSWALRSYGATGIAVAHLVAYAVHFINIAIFTKKHLLRKYGYSDLN